MIHCPFTIIIIEDSRFVEFKALSNLQCGRHWSLSPNNFFQSFLIPVQFVSFVIIALAFDGWIRRFVIQTSLICITNERIVGSKCDFILEDSDKGVVWISTCCEYLKNSLQKLNFKFEFSPSHPLFLLSQEISCCSERFSFLPYLMEY